MWQIYELYKSAWHFGPSPKTYSWLTLFPSYASLRWSHVAWRERKSLRVLCSSIVKSGSKLKNVSGLHWEGEKKRTKHCKISNQKYFLFVSKPKHLTVFQGYKWKCDKALLIWGLHRDIDVLATGRLVLGSIHSVFHWNTHLYYVILEYKHQM